MIKRIVVAGCRNYNNYEEAKKYINYCIGRYKNVFKDYEDLDLTGAKLSVTFNGFIPNTIKSLSEELLYENN